MIFELRIVDADFQADPLMKRIERGERRALKIGGFRTRREAQRVIEPGRSPSQPGSPPHSHTGVLERNIVYALDRKTMVIGVQPVDGKNTGAPSVLERGGYDMDSKGRTQFVQARPFMGPALKRVTPEVPAMFEDLFRS